METDKLRAIVKNMEEFGLALDDVKKLVSRIQQEVNKLVGDFKSKLPAVAGEESVQIKVEDTSDEAEVKEETMYASPMSAKTSTPMSLQSGGGGNRRNRIRYSWESTRSTPSDDSQFSTTSSASPRFFECNRHGCLQRTRLPEQWWTEQRDQSAEGDKTTIDWERDQRERIELRCCLLLREGKRRQNSTYDELEDLLTKWTGRMVQWSVLKRGRATNGKPMMSIKLRSMEDRQKILDMKDDIAEEGYLCVGEALSYVERKERWKMLEMTHRLRAEGYYVVFDNKKICVNDDYWRYEWTNGWKRIHL